MYPDEVGGRHKVSSGGGDEDGDAASQGGRDLNSMAGGCPMAVVHPVSPYPSPSHDRKGPFRVGGFREERGSWTLKVWCLTWN